MSRYRGGRARAAGWLLALALGLAAQLAGAQAAELTPQEARGKRIYEEGVGSGNPPVTATIANTPDPVPGSMVPCAVCHGADGSGVADDGTAPPDIRWSVLVDPEGHRHGSGRAHPAFDYDTIARAISDGVDPAGNAMEAAMPRYAMLLTDLSDLMAYMRRLEHELDPGLSADRITLATLLPAGGELAGAGQAMKAVMHAVFDEVNVAGGVHGRRIELVSADHVADPTFAGWTIRDLVREQRPFALVGPWLNGIEAPVAAAVDEVNIPVVGALSLTPGLAGGSNRYLFYLQAGLEGQTAALAHYAATLMQGERPRMVVIHPVGEHFAAPVAAVVRQGQAANWATVPVLPYARGSFDAAYLAGELSAKGAQGVFFLGPEEDLRQLLSAADGRDWAPRVFVPGVFASEAMFDYPARFDGRVYLAVSSLPSDMDPGGAEQFKRVHDQQQLSYAHLGYQVQAYAAARLVVEAMQRVGPDLRREALIATLESLHDFQTGVLPPLGFDGGRRVGTDGAHLVSLDLAGRRFARAGGWIAVPPPGGSD